MSTTATLLVMVVVAAVAVLLVEWSLFWRSRDHVSEWITIPVAAAPIILLLSLIVYFWM